MSVYTQNYNIDGWPVCKDSEPMGRKDGLAELQKLESQISALKEENEQLKARVADQSAYILRLRKAIIDATNNAVPLDSGKWAYSIDDSVLQWPDTLKEPADEG